MLPRKSDSESPNPREVRGFLVVEGCVNCPFVEEELGGYDRNEVQGYHCRLYQRRFDLKERYPNQYGGTDNEVPKGFPKFCRLKPVTNTCSTIYHKYKRIVAQLDLLDKIIKE